MKQILLNDYGIENPVIAVSNSVTEVITLSNKRVKKGHQTPLIDVPFTCPISKDVWKSEELHNARCQYKYCKSGWNFRLI